VLEEKNWPPFFPIIHNDIGNEIPVHLQRTLYVAFASLLGNFFPFTLHHLKCHNGTFIILQKVLMCTLIYVW
jgi:hypothetical protein